MHSLKAASLQATHSKFRLCLGVILIGANLRLPITGVGPVLGEIQDDLHLGGLAAGILNSVPLLIFALLSLIAPSLGRRYGAERVLGISMIAIAVGTVLRSLPLTGAIWIGTLLLSAGIAFGNVLLPGLVKRDFPSNAASVIGLYAAAMAGMGGVAAGLAVPISKIAGSDWRWSLGIWSVLAIITLLVWFPQMRQKAAHATSKKLISEPQVSPWKHSIGWQVSLFFALHSFVFYSIVDWFSSYAIASGTTAARAGTYLLIYQLIAIATNLGSAPLIKRANDQVTLGFLCGILLVIGSTGLQLAPAWSLLWLIFAGLGAGVAMVTSLSLFALRTRDHHQAAALSGMAQFVGYAGAALGPLLVGTIHDLTQEWRWPFAMLLVCSILTLIFATLAGRSRHIE